MFASSNIFHSIFGTVTYKVCMAGHGSVLFGQTGLGGQCETRSGAAG